MVSQLTKSQLAIIIHEWGQRWGVQSIGRNGTPFNRFDTKNIDHNINALKELIVTLHKQNGYERDDFQFIKSQVLDAMAPIDRAKNKEKGRNWQAMYESTWIIAMASVFPMYNPEKSIPPTLEIQSNYKEQEIKNENSIVIDRPLLPLDVGDLPSPSYDMEDDIDIFAALEEDDE